MSDSVDKTKPVTPAASDDAPSAVEEPPVAPPQQEAQLIPPLRERHRRFVLEYVIDLNGSAAAVRAGYARGKAGGRASELLRRPEVQIAIREEMKERDKRLRLTAERIIREAMCIAFADPSRVAHWGPDASSWSIPTISRRTIARRSNGSRSAAARARGRSASRCTTSSRRWSCWRA